MSVRLLNISLGGCAVATDRPLGPGTVVRLRTRLADTEYDDTLRILRSRRRPGASPTPTVAGRFQWRTRLGAASLRGIVPVSRTCP